MTAPVAPEMQRAALEWQAEEAERARRTQSQVEALQVEQQEPEPAAAQQAPTAPTSDPMLLQLALGLWVVADKLVVQFAGDGLALDAREKAQLAASSVPVLEKYLPGGLGALLTTPEGQLLAAVALVYASKLAVPSPAPVASPAVERPAA